MFYLGGGIGGLIAIIIVACIALSKSKRGAIGCSIAVVVFVGLLIYTCEDMRREEEERKEWNKKFQERLRKKDEIWLEYSRSLPEDYYEREEYLRSGKDAEARKRRDRALKKVDEDD